AEPAAEIAARLCASRGWTLVRELGAGGTAPVFEVSTPAGARALKINDLKFSSGQSGEIEEKRIEKQVALSGHACRSLVQVYDGGRFENRLYLLMSRAPGVELEKHLADVPRNNIQNIVHQVAEAAMFLRDKDLCHRDIKAANVFVSEDYLQTTLLDISVIRDIHDPIGLGTDHDGMLPVVATARYSPPEYLFRLLEPGPELWNALSVYQLGGLLHDLIMRRPLFQAEYEKSALNRYRFAWIVATSIPKIDAIDVDRDLVLLATRALDKNWTRRSLLSLEDFLLDGRAARRKHALWTLGLRAESTTWEESPMLLERVAQAAGAVEQSVIQYFASHHVTVMHSVSPGSTDTTKVIRFAWDVEIDHEKSTNQNEFAVTLRLVQRTTRTCFELGCKLSCWIDGATFTKELPLPDMVDEPGVDSL